MTPKFNHKILIVNGTQARTLGEDFDTLFKVPVSIIRTNSEFMAITYTGLHDIDYVVLNGAANNLKFLTYIKSKHIPCGLYTKPKVKIDQKKHRHCFIYDNVKQLTDHINNVLSTKMYKNSRTDLFLPQIAMH